MNVLYLLLVALPICVAQFRIQGPSDGNRAAESLSVDEGGKVAYSGHRAPSTGGFSIQGASDGHSNVEGGSDGHSHYQQQAATAGGLNKYFQPEAVRPPAPAFSIQGASDGHSRIQGSYDGSGSAQSLQYDDPSGYRVNWRSYDRPVRPPSQPEAQYTEARASLPRTPQPQRARARPQQHAKPQPQPQPQRQDQSYEPPLPAQQTIQSAPDEIKQLLYLQKMLPYLNIVPEPYRYENIVAQQPQSPARYQAEEQPRYVPEPKRPPSRGKARAPSRQKRQARRQPPAEQHIRYSTSLPADIEQILKFQQQTPYINGIPEQFRFNAEAAAKDQLDAVRAHFQQAVNNPPERYAPKSRQRRQAEHGHLQQQPRRQQPPAEPQPHYSTNLPDFVKNVLQFQAQIPYNILPNLVGVARPEKPYVPQPVQSPAPVPAASPRYQSQGNVYQDQPRYQGQADVAYQGSQAASPYQNQIGSYQNQAQIGAYQAQGNPYQGQPNIYKNQADAYQPRENAYNEEYQSELKYSQQHQGQPGEGGVRPVTENQY